MKSTPYKSANLVLVLAISSAFFTAITAQGETPAEYIRANYTKFEYRIPMRDGKSLFTAVYVPNQQTEKYPILMFRTPYSVGPYGADAYRTSLGPNEEFAKEGFIFVHQDVRGRFMSEGEYVNMRPHIAQKISNKDVDESTDTYDTIDWLVKNVPNNNGRVGQWGVSYPGFYCSAGMIDSHPALKAVSPQAPIADWFWDDMHRHGAFVLPLAFNFFSSFGKAREGLTTEWPERFDHKTPDGYQFFKTLGPVSNANERHFQGEIKFWNEIVAHPNYDEFWQSRNILPHLKNVKAAVMTVGGWFDTEDLYGPLATYAAVERHNPGINNTLVMGPWPHGGWNRGDGQSLGEAEFGFKTARYYQQHVDLPFFLFHLKQQDDQPLPPEALVFETGANRWRQFDAWPPRERQMKSLYFQPQELLTWEPPTADQADGANPTFDEFISDPNKPVPYTMEITTRWARNYMTEDQRFAAWRPDVLVFQTEPLESDVTIAGPIVADLRVSTSAGDCDWMVKVIDVFPGEVPNADEDAKDRGETQRLVRAEAFRGRFRESYQRPKPFVPNEPTKVTFQLWDVLHTFQRDHRIMIQVQSTWFPLIDRNPQKYVPNIFEARESDFMKATHRVYRSPELPSRIEVGVLE